MSDKEFLSFDDLYALDSSPHLVRESFKKRYGKNPDGIALNKETYFSGAVKPPITEQYGHYTYKTPGKYQFTSEDVTSTDVIIGSSTAVNKSDAKATMTLNVTGEWSESTTYSSSSTTGLKFSNEITIKGVFTTGIEFSVSVTSETSETTSVKRSSTTSVSVDVPPKSKVKVSMVGMLKSEKLGFKVPIDVNGMFGANFPSQVDGHYFWFNDARIVLPKTSGEITGTIENANVVETTTEIEKSIPI